jgi:hypothetical protein
MSSGICTASWAEISRAVVHRSGDFVHLVMSDDPAAPMFQFWDDDPAVPTVIDSLIAALAEAKALHAQAVPRDLVTSRDPG